VGLFTNPCLVFIPFSIWIGAAQEASMVRMRSALGGIPVSRAMLREFRTLAPDDPATRVLEVIRGGLQQDFPVVVDGRVVGVLLRSDVLHALAQRRSDWRVADVIAGTSRSSTPGTCSTRPSRDCSRAPVTRFR
jgi:tRNA nucleotidyltransferase (CCA-adding enzyme)